MADGDKVDPADEPDAEATPTDPAAEAEDAVAEPSNEELEAGEELELVPAGSAVRSAKNAPEAGSSGGRGKKGKATPKQRQGAPEHKRTGPITFLRQAVEELRKVVYPTGSQLGNYFVVVLIFVLFIIAYVSLLDLGIGAGLFRIFA
ncbi:MAG: preprotein translocase subunit SecE [Microlunatus sp.]